MAAAVGMTERDRRLLQREQERRARLISAGKQSLATPSYGGHEEREAVIEGRRQAMREYENSLQQQRAATAAAAQVGDDGEPTMRVMEEEEEAVWCG